MSFIQSSILKKGVDIRLPKRSFTLMELMIVVILVGVVASFATVSFVKMYKKNLERNMAQALLQFGVANKIYKAKYGRYWIPASQVGNANVTVDSMCSPFYAAENDPGICAAHEQIITILNQMQPSVIDDYYTASNFAQEFNFNVYTNLTSMGPGTTMVYKSTTDSVCCNNASFCLVTPTCT